jgi:K+-transporting ATPase A subunit
MNSVMNTALGRGSAMSANVRAMKDASCARSPSQSKLVAHPVGTTGPLFVGLMIGVILIIGALTYFPAYALGPIVEQLLMHIGRTF